MKKYTIYLFLQFFFFSFSLLFGQKSEILPFEKLEKQILEDNIQGEDALKLITKYIRQVKKTDNNEALYNGYLFAFNCSNTQKRLKYADSLTILAMKMQDDQCIGLAYEKSATVYLNIYDYPQAIDQILIAHDYLKKVKYREDDRIALLTLAKLKLLTGDKQEAKAIAEEAVEYFRWKKDVIPKLRVKTRYIGALCRLIRINASLYLFQENEKLLKEAYTFVKKHKGVQYMLPKIRRIDAYNFYCKGDYRTAITVFNRAFKEYEGGIKTSLFWIKFYTGMCYWKLGEQEKALPYFKEIEQDYLENGNTSMEFKPMFEFFIDYYKEKNNQDALKYANMYIGYQKKNEKNLSLISQKIASGYNLKKLEEEKERLEKERQKERWGFVLALGGIVGLLIGFLIWRRYKKQNETVLEHHQSPTPPTADVSTKVNYQDYAPIHPITVDDLLKKLDTFEREKSFLQPKTRLSTLAETFGVNKKYVSVVIKVSRGKTFNDYLNTLRLDYLQEQIKTNNETLASRKVKDISEELGYTTPEAFTNLFRERFGSSPTEYFSVEEE